MLNCEIYSLNIRVSAVHPRPAGPTDAEGAPRASKASPFCPRPPCFPGLFRSHGVPLIPESYSLSSLRAPDGTFYEVERCPSAHAVRIKIE